MFSYIMIRQDIWQLPKQNVETWMLRLPSRIHIGRSRLGHQLQVSQLGPLFYGMMRNATNLRFAEWNSVRIPHGPHSLQIIPIHSNSLNSLVCFFLPLGKTLEQILGAMVPSCSIFIFFDESVIDRVSNTGNMVGTVGRMWPSRQALWGRAAAFVSPSCAHWLSYQRIFPMKRHPLRTLQCWHIATG